MDVKYWLFKFDLTIYTNLQLFCLRNSEFFNLEGLFFIRKALNRVLL